MAEGGCGTVTVPELEDSVATLKQVNGPVLGIVLNKARAGEGYYYQYKYLPEAKSESGRQRLRRSARAKKVPVGQHAQESADS